VQHGEGDLDAGFFSTGACRPDAAPFVLDLDRAVLVDADPILLPKPASASSTALSIASCTTCRECTVCVHAGMRRTGSSPLSAWIADAS